MSTVMQTIIVACGLKAEAKIAAGPDVTVIAGGGDGLALEAALTAAVRQGGALVSFGIAGGLAPELRPGAIVVARRVMAPSGRYYEANIIWAQALAGRLHAPLADFAGVDTPLAGVAEKAALFRDRGASIVDMESHIVARVAAAHGLSFAAIRVVADPAERQLPHAATVGMRADGRVDLPAVLTSLARNPRQLPGLIRTAFDARAAFAGLLRGRQLLGADYGRLGIDLGDPLLDMA
ncbi:phosphorylase [Beijerinckia sp. L45]|uniref:phosphorylase family protein n=1 Tax=Beijerinckia sp. L45 TaxID=1641855 RepID=UPI001FED52AC|nr:phosphorylase [Beijerinckia sp. L45]